VRFLLIFQNNHSLLSITALAKPVKQNLKNPLMSYPAKPDKIN